MIRGRGTGRGRASAGRPAGSLLGVAAGAELAQDIPAIEGLPAGFCAGAPVGALLTVAQPFGRDL